MAPRWFYQRFKPPTPLKRTGPGARKTKASRQAGKSLCTEPSGQRKVNAASHHAGAAAAAAAASAVTDAGVCSLDRLHWAEPPSCVP